MKQQGSHIPNENQDGEYDLACGQNKRWSKLGQAVFFGLGGLHATILHVKSLQSPHVSLWDAAPDLSNTAVKPCQQKSLRIICCWVSIQQGTSMVWISNLNYYLGPRSSYPGNLKPGSAFSPLHHSPYLLLQDLSLQRDQGGPSPLTVLEVAGLCSVGIACPETSTIFYKLLLHYRVQTNE